MRSTWLIVASGVLCASCAQPPGEAPATAEARQDGGALAATPETAGSQPIVIPPDDLEWYDLDPDGAPGVRLANLWGDPGSGRFGAFMRLPAGFSAPMHTHTHPMKVVIVSGTYVQQPDGGALFRLGPGGYFMQPGGDYRHATSCDAASDCVFFVESEGAFDLFPVEEAPASM